MTAAMLEHVNITVSDPKATADWLCDMFGWRIRWHGTAIHGGLTFHVGNDDSYLAVYSGVRPVPLEGSSYERIGGLNHIGVVVPDLDAVEAKVKAAGLNPHSHGDYEPGRRFYFDNADGIEFEVVSYA